MTLRAAVAVGVAAFALAAGAAAQTNPVAMPPPGPTLLAVARPPVSTRMANDERFLFGVLTASYGFRLGTAINLAAFDRTPDGPNPETYWILPGALALALPVAALLIEHRFPLRRGRSLTMGVGGTLGYLTATSIASLVRGDAFPSGKTLSGSPTFIGTTSGILLGALVGHFTDATPADALWVGTGGIGGALLGGLLCGAVRCGADLGAWALVGEVGLVTTALVLRSTVRPTQPTMRLVGLGALGLGGLMGGGVLLASAVRDHGITREGAQRSTVFGLGGLVLGAVTFFAIGRRTDPMTTVMPTAQVSGQAMVLGVSITNR